MKLDFLYDWPDTAKYIVYGIGVGMLAALLTESETPRRNPGRHVLHVSRRQSTSY